VPRAGVPACARVPPRAGPRQAPAPAAGGPAWAGRRAPPPPRGGTRTALAGAFQPVTATFELRNASTLVVLASATITLESDKT